MHPDHVQDEDVSAPRRDHVDIRESRHEAEGERERSFAKGEYPKVKSRHHRSESDGLVVVASADTPHEVGRDDPHDPSGEDGAANTPGYLIGQGTGEEGGDGAAPSRDVAADVV